MKRQSEETTPPIPGDLEGWRQAAANHRLIAFRPEAIVSALQELGASADTRVKNALAKHVSDILIKMLRGYIGTNHPNSGEDIIARVRGKCSKRCSTRIPLTVRRSGRGSDTRSSFARWTPSPRNTRHGRNSARAEGQRARSE